MPHGCGLLFTVTLLALGCAAPPEKFLPVAGQVKVNGKVLQTGVVSYRPDASRGNKSLHHPTGLIDQNGHYELTTIQKKGAPPGWYKVLVFANQNQKQGTVHPLLPMWATDVKYTQEATTDLVVEVVEQPMAGAYDLKLAK